MDSSTLLLFLRRYNFLWQQPGTAAVRSQAAIMNGKVLSPSSCSLAHRFCLKLSSLWCRTPILMQYVLWWCLLQSGTPQQLQLQQQQAPRGSCVDVVPPPGTYTCAQQVRAGSTDPC